MLAKGIWIPPLFGDREYAAGTQYVADITKTFARLRHFAKDCHKEHDIKHPGTKG